MDALKKKAGAILTGAIARLSFRAAAVLDGKGHKEQARALSRWGMVIAGSAAVAQEIGKRGEAANVEELRALAWLVGEELRRMADPTAGVFLTMAEPGFEIDVQKMFAACGNAIEDADDWPQREVIRRLWALLEPQQPVAPAAPAGE